MASVEHAVGRGIVDLRVRMQPASSTVNPEPGGAALDPEVAAMLYAMRLSGYTSLSAGGVEKARGRMRHDAQVHAGNKTGVGSVRDLSIDGPAGALGARHYTPETRDSAPPLIVFYHGGGFALGDLETHDEPCRMLCRYAEAHVLAIDYRRAPEHLFPAATDDALAALRWAQTNAKQLGADPNRIAVAGDSAGANLATVACLMAAAAGDALPQLQLLFYPCTDSTMLHPSRSLFAQGYFLTQADIDFFFRLYVGSFDDLSDPRVSPLRAKQLTNLPPSLVVTAGFDPLRDEGEAYAAALRAAGNKVELRRMPSLIHGFLNMGGMSRLSRETTRELAQWAHHALRTAPSAATSASALGAV
jgi:acetyl esterase